MDTPIVNTLTERISIIEMVSTTTSNGEPVKSENEVLSCRANHEEISVSEEEEGKVRALFTDRFTIRYRKELTKGRANAMFVKDAEDFKYGISSVVPIGRKKYLRINTVRRE